MGKIEGLRGEDLGMKATINAMVSRWRIISEKGFEMADGSAIAIIYRLVRS